jgi:hypothetical protein
MKSKTENTKDSKNSSSTEHPNPAANTQIPNLLIENEDYYIENGFYVFTASYLKKRGYCCNSGCRHCPY